MWEKWGCMGMGSGMNDTEWVLTELNEYYRIYKGMRLFIKVKGDYSKLYIWDWHRRRCLDVWFDGRVRRDYKDEVEDVQKGMEARANEWIEMMADGYYDYFEPDEDDSILGFDDRGEAQ